MDTVTCPYCDSEEEVCRDDGHGCTVCQDEKPLLSEEKESRMTIEHQYLDLLHRIVHSGSPRIDRTGTGTYSLFGEMLTHDFKDGFPLLTTKRVFFKAVFEELMFFLRGQTNSKILEAKGVNIWKEWALKDGSLGPIYGKQWRDWAGVRDTSKDSRHAEYESGTVDQLAEVINAIKLRPFSRRHVISTWNVSQLPDETKSPQWNVSKGRMALAPCHVSFQFYVQGSKLSCLMYQRSADAFLGLPFNISSYALLLVLIAQETGYQCGELKIALGDVHVYLNHLEQVELQESRDIRPLPGLGIKNVKSRIEDYEFDDIALIDYNPHPAIKAPIAI